MKLTCAREELIKSLQIAQRATDLKSNIMVLRNVLISAEKSGEIEISGFDHKIGIRTRLHGEVETPGQIACPSALLNDVLAVKTDKEASLSVADTSLELYCGRAKYKFACIAADEFPSFDSDLAGKDVLTADAKLFRKGVVQTVFATNPEDNRAFMGGILIVFDKGSLEFVATDGHRLARRKIVDKTFKGEGRKVIVPARALHELIRILPPETETIRVAVTGPTILFSFDNIAMTSRLIETEYPKYEKVIPSEHKGRCTVGRTALIGAVRGAAIMARTKENRDLVELVISGGCMRFTSNTADVGSAFEEIEAKQEGDDLSIAYNSRYMLDFLNVVDEDEVVLEYKGNLEPGVFKTSDPDYQHVLMPIKV